VSLTIAAGIAGFVSTGVMHTPFCRSVCDSFGGHGGGAPPPKVARFNRPRRRSFRHPSGVHPPASQRSDPLQEIAKRICDESQGCPAVMAHRSLPHRLVLCREEPLRASFWASGFVVVIETAGDDAPITLRGNGVRVVANSEEAIACLGEQEPALGSGSAIRNESPNLGRACANDPAQVRVTTRGAQTLEPSTVLGGSSGPTRGSSRVRRTYARPTLGCHESTSRPARRRTDRRSNRPRTTGGLKSSQMTAFARVHSPSRTLA
jgi:hypothetical protein